MKQLLLLLSFIVCVSCKNEELKIYDYAGLEPLINKTDDKVHVVNFWATWCAPCIKELPYFERINSDYSSKGVEILLVSLDFPRQYETKLKPYLKEKQLKSEVVCFDYSLDNVEAACSEWIKERGVTCGVDRKPVVWRRACQWEVVPTTACTTRRKAYPTEEDYIQ